MAYYESNVFGNLSEIVDKACKKKKKRRYKSRELIKAWSNPRGISETQNTPKSLYCAYVVDLIRYTLMYKLSPMWKKRSSHPYIDDTHLA